MTRSIAATIDDPLKRRRLFVDRGVDHVGDRPAVERRPAGEHLEQDRAGGEEIAAGIDGLALDGLGRHVARRAHDHAGPRDVGVRARSRRPSSGRARPKSSSFTPCGVTNTFDGLRSRWMMPRACRADSAERISRPTETACGDVQRSAPQLLRQRLALEQLHGDEQAAGVFADLVDLADVGMVDAGRRARFTPQALARRLVARRAPRIVFSATMRSSRSSRASYTTPMPPSPSLRVMA